MSSAARPGRNAAAPGLLASALLAAAGSCQAGSPLATEDAGLLEPGQCELEPLVERGARPQVRTRSVQLGCGIGLDTQLALSLGAERPDRTREAGISGKTVLRELTDDQAGIALAYALEAEKPSGLRTRHAGSELTLVLSVPQGPWLWHAQLGWHRDHPDAQNRTVWGLALERAQALGAWYLMGELVGDDRTEPWLRLGARWNVLPQRLYLYTAWQRQMDSARATRLTGGLTLSY